MPLRLQKLTPGICAADIRLLSKAAVYMLILLCDLLIAAVPLPVADADIPAARQARAKVGLCSMVRRFYDRIALAEPRRSQFPVGELRQY